MIRGLRLADNNGFAGTEILREEPLPNLQPLLLLLRGQLPRLLEAPGQEFLEPGAEDLHDEHRLPVRHGEAPAVSVEGDEAGVHVEADVAAEECYGKGVCRGGLVRIVDSVQSSVLESRRKQ